MNFDKKFSIKAIQYFCLMFVITCGFITIVSSGGGDDSGGSSNNQNTNGNNGIVVDGTTETYSALDVISNNNTEAAVIVMNRGRLTLSDSTITKTYDTSSPITTSGTTSSIPSGIGGSSAGVYVGANSSATLSNVDIDTAVNEGKALVANGSGASITYTTGFVTTATDNSHGAFATQGGSISLKDVSITTDGQHCSALATDQGGGTVIAEGGEFTVNGEYSAGIYSTGDIRASNAEFYAYLDRVVCIEGGSDVTLNNCSLWADTKDAVMIFQSFSGDAPPGGSTFTMTGGSIEGVADDLPLFYVTNTTGAIKIADVTLTSASGIILRALKGAWMDNPPNFAVPTHGGTVTFTADRETLTGDIELDQYSSITATFIDTDMTGSINTANSGGVVTLTLDSGSTWDVTGDSYIDSLDDEDGTYSNITGSGKVYVNDVQVHP